MTETTESNQRLCALVGHDLRSTSENGPGLFWLVPPARCEHCHSTFPGLEGIPPANRPRDTGYKPRQSVVKEPHG